jgi:hypothetical protein
MPQFDLAIVKEAGGLYQFGCFMQGIHTRRNFVSVKLQILLNIFLEIVPINTTMNVGQQPFPSPSLLKKILTWRKVIRSHNHKKKKCNGPKIEGKAQRVSTISLSTK